MRGIILLISLLFLGFCGHAAVKPALGKAKPKAPAVLRLDTSSVKLKTLDTAAIQAYHQQAEFQYHEDAPEGLTWWDRFWRWFWSLFQYPGHSKGTAHFFTWFLRILFIGLGAGAVIFIALRLSGMDVMGLFRRKPASAGLPYSEQFENIHEINFDDELERAISQHNYRLAVRLLYLNALKQLDDSGLIDWQLHKTNSAYVNELPDGRRRNLFSQLTRQFEYVWYGEFLIDAQVFQQVNALFQNFKQGMA